MSRHDAGAQALIAVPERADTVRALEATLQSLWPGLRCQWLASVSSTNTLLAERARSASFEPSLMVADEQTQGRGRLGRQWQSRPGASLTFSIALPLARDDWSGLSLAVGVALVDALAPSDVDARKSSRPRLELKWPNDLWLVDADRSGRKLGGILIEGIAARERERARAFAPARIAVIGVGLNLLPLESVAVSSGYASLSELWPHELEAGDVLSLVAPALLTAVHRFAREGFAAFAERYARYDLLRGRLVHTSSSRELAASGMPDHEVEGIAQGIDANGALLVAAADGVHAVSSGEVSVRLASFDSAPEATREGSRGR